MEARLGSAGRPARQAVVHGMQFGAPIGIGKRKSCAILRQPARKTAAHAADALNCDMHAVDTITFQGPFYGGAYPKIDTACR